MRPVVLNSLALLFTMLATTLFGGSLYFLADEESQYAGWWVKDAVVSRSELKPQSGPTAWLGLKPVYRGRVYLNYEYGGQPTVAVVDFVHYSLYQVDLERLQSRTAVGSTLRVRLEPYSKRKVHIPGTHASATWQLVNLVGLLLVIPAGGSYLLAKSPLAREPLEAAEGLS
jgi:hypothetical protein